MKKKALNMKKMCATRTGFDTGPLNTRMPNFEGSSGMRTFVPSTFVAVIQYFIRAPFPRSGRYASYLLSSTRKRPLAPISFEGGCIHRTTIPRRSGGSTRTFSNGCPGPIFAARVRW